MKKQTKSKLNKIWQKIRKPLMILSFVGNILFLLFIIVGCVGSKKQAQQTNAEDTSDIIESDIWTLRNTKWKLKDDIDINGLLTGTGNLRTGTYYFHFSIDDEQLDDGLTYYQLTAVSSGVSYNLNIRGEDDGSITNHMWCSKSSGSSSYVWNYSKVIQIYSDKPTYTSSISIPYESYEDKTLMSWFFNNAELLEAPRQQFEFLYDFNYNAICNVVQYSYFVEKFWNTDSTNDYKTLRYGFISGGRFWTNINLYFYDGTNKRYMKNGEVLTNTGNGSAFYSYMEYYNSDTGERTIVNVRKNGYIDDINYIDIGSTWKDDTYRFISVFENRDGNDNLTNFNNNATGFTGLTNYDATHNGDIGLSNVFKLLQSAFTSLLPLLAIQILPNISIGLLVFLPLVVVIIIVIIKLVKR